MTWVTPPTFTVGEVLTAALMNDLSGDLLGVVRGGWRKSSAKDVANTTETDLLNGEITVDAGAMSSDRVLRLTAWGDWVQNSGANSNAPRFKVKLGATPTVVIDTNALANSKIEPVSTRYGWKVIVEIANLGATNSQWVSFDGKLACYVITGTDSIDFATGEGVQHTSGSTNRSSVRYLGGNSAAIDTTAAMNIQLTVINPTATSCDTKLYAAVAELV